MSTYEVHAIFHDRRSIQVEARSKKEARQKFMELDSQSEGWIGVDYSFDHICSIIKVKED